MRENLQLVAERIYFSISFFNLIEVYFTKIFSHMVHTVF